MNWLWSAAGLIVGINIGFVMGAVWNGMLRNHERSEGAGDCGSR